MVPGFPLDGGRVLRSILWGRSGNLCSATRVASIVGRVVAGVVIFVGVCFILAGDWLNGMWFALMGWFLYKAAVSSYRQIQLDDLMSRHKVIEVMGQSCVVVPPDLGVARLINEYAQPHGQQCFAVMQGGSLEGMIFFDSLRTLIRDARNKQTVDQIMISAEKLKCVAPDDELIKALNIMREQELSQVPVMQDGYVVGVVNIEKLQALIDQHSGKK
jgi:CBS domain-containing protein